MQTTMNALSRKLSATMLTALLVGASGLGCALDPGEPESDSTASAGDETAATDDAAATDETAAPPEAALTDEPANPLDLTPMIAPCGVRWTNAGRTAWWRNCHTYNQKVRVNISLASDKTLCLRKNTPNNLIGQCGNFPPPFSTRGCVTDAHEIGRC